ncbi:hypothetical protein V6Z11_D12G092900 [Gossypium hirsutum]
MMEYNGSLPTFSQPLLMDKGCKYNLPRLTCWHWIFLFNEIARF